MSEKINTEIKMCYQENDLPEYLLGNFVLHNNPVLRLMAQGKVAIEITYIWDDDNNMSYSYRGIKLAPDKKSNVFDT